MIIITIRVLIKKIHEDAILPIFAHDNDACADITSYENQLLKTGDSKVISTGIVMALPEGYECQVRPRSGLAANNGITVVNSPGTIDAGYRGEIKIILANLGTKEFRINKGMRIAQLAVRPVPKISFVEVENLDDTERATGGFGSTGN